MSFAPYQARIAIASAPVPAMDSGKRVKPGASSRKRHQLALHRTYPVDKRNQDRSDYRGTFQGWPTPNIGRIELDQRHHLQMIIQIVAECRCADSGREEQLRSAERVGANDDALRPVSHMPSRSSGLQQRADGRVFFDEDVTGERVGPYAEAGYPVGKGARMTLVPETWSSLPRRPMARGM